MHFLNEFEKYWGQDRFKKELLQSGFGYDLFVSVPFYNADEAVILRLFNEIYHTHCNVFYNIAQTGNVRIIDHIASAIPKERLQTFYFNILRRFAQNNNLSLFKRYYSMDSMAHWIPKFVEPAICNGSVEVFEFCITNADAVFLFDDDTMVSACLSGSMAMVNLIKSLHNQFDWKTIASAYLENFLHTNAKMNNELLSQLLKHVSSDDDDLKVKKNIQNIVLSCVNSSENLNADEETFRLLSKVAPDLRIQNLLPGQQNKMLLLSCLKHFKETPVPCDVFTFEEIVSFMQRAELQPSQLKFTRFIEPKTDKSILEFLNVKRTVYLYFATETDLRDIAEIVLAYL